MTTSPFADYPTPERPHPPQEVDAIPRPVILRALDLPASRSYPPHSHAVGQLAWVVAGNLRINTPKTTWLVYPARAIWLPAGTPHSVTTGAAVVRMRNVYVGDPLMTQLPQVVCALPISSLIRELIMAACRLPRLYTAASHQRLLLTLVDQITLAQTQAPGLAMPDDTRLQRVCATFLTTPAQKRTLAQWADEIGASERTLSRLFLRETGMTFAQWQRQACLTQAIQRLQAGDSITAIAHDLGYASQGAFTTMFRRMTGKPPAQFAREYARHA